MSIVSVNVHFHDGELAKLAAYFVDGYVAAVQCVLAKVKFDGGYEKYQRRYHQAVKNMALMKKFLTPAQKAEIQRSLQIVARSQAALLKDNENRSKKEQLSNYKEAVRAFEGTIALTSQDIANDLGSNGGSADAYRMALACTAADVDAVRMMNEIMTMFESVDPGNKVNPTNATQPSKAPQPSTEPKRIKEPKHMKPSQEPKPSTGRHRYKKGKKPVVDPVPSALMAGIADRLMEVKLSS